MLVFQNNQIQPSKVKIATSYQVELLELAITNYGFLVHTIPRTEISFEDFARKIEMAYDTVDNPQNAEVVRVLRELHALNAEAGAPA